MLDNLLQVIRSRTRVRTVNSEQWAPDRHDVAHDWRTVAPAAGRYGARDGAALEHVAPAARAREPTGADAGHHDDARRWRSAPTAQAPAVARHWRRLGRRHSGTRRALWPARARASCRTAACSSPRVPSASVSTRASCPCASRVVSLTRSVLLPLPLLVLSVSTTRPIRISQHSRMPPLKPSRARA